MKPPERKTRGRRGIIKHEPNFDAHASLPSLPPVKSRPTEAAQRSLIVKLPLLAARPPPRPSKIVKLKVPPIPPRPQKVVRLPMRPCNIVGVANASNAMRIEAQVEAIEQRQRQMEKVSTRPQARSDRSLPPPLSPPRLRSPVPKAMIERTNAPRRVTFNLDGPGLPPQISPPTVGLMTQQLPEGLGPYPPGFEPDAEIKSPPNMPPPMLPMASRAPASRTLVAPTKPAAAHQRDIMTLAHEHTTAPADLLALLSPPPSTSLAPPSRAPAVKPKRGRPRGGGRQRQAVVSRPVPTGIPQGPVPLYPYGHKWKLEPKDQFLRRFKRLNEASEAKKEEDKQWDALVEQSCREFRERYPNADEELEKWKMARRPANWDTHSGVYGGL